MAGPGAGTDLLQNVVTEAREAAREQLAAAWRIEVERVLDERFADLNARVEQECRSRVADASTKARRDAAARLNQALRRIRSFESEEQWGRGVVEATQGFCQRAALFVVNGPALRLQAARGVSSEARIDSTPLESAPAFAGAVESRDTIVALRTRGELSAPIADLVGEAPEQRFYLFPICGTDRVAAVIYADSEVDAGALELLATFASAVLAGRSPAADRTGLVSIQPGAAPATTAAPQASIPMSPWWSLTKQEQALHLRAQRYARVQAAEMRLYQSQAVEKGRDSRDLYGALRAAVDGAREAFRRDFLSASATMVDYLHLELLRTLANDDVALLGPQYPGPMV